MTLLEALAMGKDMLQTSGVPDSRLDAELLLSHVLNTSRMALLLKSREEIPQESLTAFLGLLSRRASREPLQYILQYQSFLGLTIYVDENVLIPRPETELLCEQALYWIRNQKLESARVLDLCTGSGALAVAFAHFIPCARVTAADISDKALAVAQKNAAAHHAEVSFCRGDFLSAVEDRRFDLIVCNPPYIPTAECASLQAEVRKEPLLALDGGGDGLCFYRRLAMEAPTYIHPGGALFCETGYDQAEEVSNLMSAAFEETRIFQDLSSIPRIVAAYHPLPGGKNVREI